MVTNESSTTVTFNMSLFIPERTALQTVCWVSTLGKGGKGGRTEVAVGGQEHRSLVRTFPPPLQHYSQCPQ